MLIEENGVGVRASFSGGDPRGDLGLLSFGDVQERLVEAVHLLWRIEGGKWPFAGDGPWHLIVKEWGDWDARDAKPIRQGPLTRAEMARLEETGAWLAMIPERDRRLVVLAVRELAKGAKVVPWMALRGPMGVTLGADGLRKRYERAVGALCRRINGSR